MLNYVEFCYLRGLQSQYLMSLGIQNGALLEEVEAWKVESRRT